MSDNGASAEGGPGGTFNEMYFFNFEPESLEENLRRIDDLGTPRAYNHYPWGWAWAGNTPLKRWKRETHEGGVTDPLIVHWPTRLAPAAGGTRHQYVHAIDVMPTLLELIGIDAPSHINGIEQTPIEGVSFAPTLLDAGTPSAHVTQYYEMMGSRALYHDGWKAVAYHPLGNVDYGDGRNAFAPFDEDEWELYHVAADFAETEDLAAAEPGKLKELIDVWWDEAERYQVLPLNNRPGSQGDRRYKRQRYVYHPGIGSLPQLVAPNLRNRPFVITAELVVPEGGGADVSGVVVCHGGPAGGYSVYVRDGRLHYVHNLLGATLSTVGANVVLPAGPVRARVVFTPSARFAGDVALFYNDLPVGEGHIARTTPITYGVEGFAVGYQRGASVSPDAYEAPFEFTPGVLRLVIVDGLGPPYRNPAAEERAALAQQ
jgi:arylsulfatase